MFVNLEVEVLLVVCQRMAILVQHRTQGHKGLFTLLIRAVQHTQNINLKFAHKQLRKNSCKLSPIIKIL